MLISCGVNDIDTKSGLEVADEILYTINRIKQKYPTIKIIISEITPRKDKMDEEVLKCNSKILINIRSLENVFLVEQQNLRDPNWSMHHDVKHIKKRCIPKFAANLKKGLRLAYGIDHVDRSQRNFTSGSYNTNEPPLFRTQSNVESNNSDRNKTPLGIRLTNIAGYNYNDHYSNYKKVLLNKIADAIKDL